MFLSTFLLLSTFLVVRRDFDVDGDFNDELELLLPPPEFFFFFDDAAAATAAAAGAGAGFAVPLDDRGLNFFTTSGSFFSTLPSF